MEVTDFVNWSTTTFCFYLLIPFACFFLSKFDFIVVANNHINNNMTNNPKIGTFLASIILICIKCFSITGKDVQGGYFKEFLFSDSFSSMTDNTVEFGFRLLNLLIYHLGENYYLLIFICGLITVYPVVFFVYKYSNRLNVGLTLFMYATLFYIQGFSLMRLYMASSIALFSMNSLIHKKYKSSIIWLIIASLFHRSVSVLFIVLILCLLKQVRVWIITLVLSIFLFIFIYMHSFVVSFFSGRYEIYKTQTVSDVGLAIFIKYIPLFILLWYVSRYNLEYIKVSYYILILGFYIGILSYFIPIFGRMQAVFLPIIFIIGYCSRILKERAVITQKSIDFLFIIYGIVQLIVYIKAYYNFDDIMPYSSILGFTI